MTQEPPPSPPIGQAGVARLLRAHLKRVGCLVRRGGRPDRWIELASLVVGQMAADAGSLLAGEANVTLSQVGSVEDRRLGRRLSPEKAIRREQSAGPAIPSLL